MHQPDDRSPDTGFLAILGSMADDLLGHFEGSAAPGHETWYHLTDNPRFALDPTHEPEDNTFAISDRSGRKGIYLARDPESWFSAAGQGYARPYLAEFHVPKEISEHDSGGRWGGEIFLSPEHYGKLHLHRVIPVDAHVREQYGAHGWIEEHHGSEFDTGEPLRRNPANRHYPFKPGWNEPSAYRYPGPDVRDMTPEQHDLHRDRWLDYLKNDRGFADEDVDYYRQQHDSHRTAAARPAREEPLPMEPGLYYRTHHKDAPFGREHARTQNIGEPPSPELAKYWEPKPGYSAFWNPHHLHQHHEEMGWSGDKDTMKGRRVLMFRGTPVGEGADGEPRVMPESDKPESSMSWSQFQKRLEITPNGYGRWHEHTWGDGPHGQMVDDGYRTIGHFEAAARPGRDQQHCPCCKGSGSHGDQCKACNGTGFVDKGETVEHCPGQPQPKRRHWRQAAAGGPVYYHGYGRDERALTGIDAWDNAGTFVSSDPEVAALYGPRVDRIEMQPDARVHKAALSNLDAMLSSLHQAREAGADVLEFHPHKDFVGHIILNPEKIASREPWSGRNVTASAQDGGMTVPPHEYSAGRMLVSDIHKPGKGELAPRPYTQRQMAADIKRRGVEQPLTIEHATAYGGNPTVINGLHRLDAAERAGVAEVPVVVRHFPGQPPPMTERRPATEQEFNEAYDIERAGIWDGEHEATLQAEAAADDDEWGYESYTPPAERRESVRHILDHYLPSDASTWGDVRDNMDFSFAGDSRRVLDDVRRSGEVRRPIPIDYEQTPPRVMNGHTRLISADMAGVADVPTRQHHGFMDPDDPDEYGNQPYHRGHWTNKPEWQESLRAEGAADYRQPHQGPDPTDWEEVLRRLRYRKRSEPEMHRGMAVTLPQELHDFVTDSQQTPDRQAQAIAEYLRTRGLGTHWSTDPRVSRDYARTERDKQPGSLRVTVHARLPELEHIETDPAKLHDGAVFRHDNYLLAEREIPLKEGAPVHVTGVTWYGVNGNQKRRGNLYGQEHIAVALPAAEASFEYPLAPGHLGEQGYRITDESRGYIAGGWRPGGSTVPEQSWGTFHMTHPSGESHGHLDYGQVGSSDTPYRTVQVEDLQTRPEHRGKGIASALMDHLYAQHPEPAEIEHSYRTDGPEGGTGWWDRYIGRRPEIAAREERQRMTDEAQDLMDRYEGGRGQVKFDSDEEGGEPYYELEHRLPNGRPSGWYVKHYGGSYMGIYHRATGDTEHEAISLPTDNREGKLLPSVGHQHLEENLSAWHDEPEGYRHHLETEDPQYDRDARAIQRWKRRHLGSAGDATPFEAAAAPDPVDIARALDAVRDHQQEQHQDDLANVPDWEPLHRALPADEHGGWMFMQRQQAPHGEVSTYRHGISRAELSLDAQGRAWGRGKDSPDSWHGPFEPSEVLRHRGHYQALSDLGAAPQTAYDEDYRAQRNKALRDAGYNVVEGASAAEPALDVVAHFEQTAAVPEYGPKPEHDWRGLNARNEDPDYQETAERWHDEDKAWESGIRRGLSLGRIDFGRAKELGYHPNGHEVRNAGWEGLQSKWAPLPQDMYHVTTDLPGVRASGGLKTREELGQHVRGGYGLGGGESDTISVTTDPELARGLLRGLHEYHRFINHGDPAALLDAARRGEGASHPYHAPVIAQYGRSDWKDGDELPYRLHAILRGKTAERSALAGKNDEEMAAEGWHPSPHPDNYGWTAPKGSFHTIYERDATPDEKLHDRSYLYKQFSFARDHAGGPPDPMFFTNDEKGFAARNPAHFGLLHLRPRPGAQGYPVNGMSEWRTASGDALEVHRAERLEDGHIREASLVREAAGHLVNPLTGGSEWFHGTQAPREEFMHGFHDPADTDPEQFETPDSEPTGYWQTSIGNHFAASHNTARAFARGEHESGGNSWGDYGEPAVIHARLHMRNPKVYASEFDLDSDAYEHAWRAGNHPSSHLSGDREDDEETWPSVVHLHDLHGDREIPRGLSSGISGSFGIIHTSPDRSVWMNTHPDRYEIAQDFKRHLQAQGHDGIVYGNEIERSSENHPHANIAAAAFDPRQVEITRHHDAVSDEPEPELNGHLAFMEVTAMTGPADEQPPKDARFFHGRTGTYPAAPGDLLVPQPGAMRHMYYTTHLPTAARAAAYGQPLNDRGYADLDAEALPGHVYEVVPETASGRRIGRHAIDPDSGLPGAIDSYRTKGRLRVLHEVDRETGEPIQEAGGADHAVVAHFEQPKTAGGPYFQQKLFHMQPDPRLHRDDSGRHNPDDPEAGYRYRREHDEEYQPDECPECGGDRHFRERHAEEHEAYLHDQDWYTDWEGMSMPSHIHRGMAVHLPQGLHDYVHDESVPVADRAGALARHVAGEQDAPNSLGHYWSESPDQSKGYAEHRQPWLRPRPGEAGEHTPVMVHAEFPGREHIETDPETLQHWKVLKYGYGRDNLEYPIKEDAPIHLTGVSWARPGHRHHDHDFPLERDDAWTHHEFGGEGIRAHASGGNPGEALEILAHFAQNPPCHYCGEPLDDDDVRDGASAHEECSDMRWCEPHQEHHDDPAEAEEHNETYTDWGGHLPFEGGIHRGITVRLPPEVHAVVHDESRPGSERAEALSRHLSGESLGAHWTDHEPIARAWGSGEGALFGPSGQERSDPSWTHVVMHAASPDDEHIETDPGVLSGRNMLGFDHQRSEREIPLRDDAPVTLTGLSWKRAGTPDDTWQRHELPHPHQHTAALETTAEDRSGDRYVTCGQGHSHWGAYGAAGLLIRHKDGNGTYRYLLQKRSPEVHEGGTWSTPGGALLRGESPEAGARREAEEELGQLPEGITHHHTFTDDHGPVRLVNPRCPEHGLPVNREARASCACTHPAGGGWAYHTVVMDSPTRFRPGGGDEDSEWESEGHRWVTPEQMKSLPLHPSFAASWDRVRKSGALEVAAVTYHPEAACPRCGGRNYGHHQLPDYVADSVRQALPAPAECRNCGEVFDASRSGKEVSEAAEKEYRDWEEATANRTYGGERLFHGTRSELRPGEMLTADEATRHPAFPDDESRGYVHATPKGEEADYWAQHADARQTHDRMMELGRGRELRDRENPVSVYRKRIYEVEPTGPVEGDPNGEGESFRTAHPMRVVREVRPLDCPECSETEGRSVMHWPEHPHHEYLQQMADEDDEEREGHEVVAHFENDPVFGPSLTGVRVATAEPEAAGIRSYRSEPTVVERHMEDWLRRQRSGHGWETELIPNRHFVSSPALTNGGVTHLMRGYMNGNLVGVIGAGASDNMAAWKVHNVHVTPGHRPEDVASTLMDSFYDHAKALGGRWIDHGRKNAADDALWRDYTPPHPEMNIHSAHPDQGWKDYFRPPQVHRDMLANARNFPASSPQPEWESTSEMNRSVGNRWKRARGLPGESRAGEWPERPVNGFQEELHSPGGWAQHLRDARRDFHYNQRAGLPQPGEGGSGGDSYEFMGPLPRMHSTPHPAISDAIQSARTLRRPMFVTPAGIGDDLRYHVSDIPHRWRAHLWVTPQGTWQRRVSGYYHDLPGYPSAEDVASVRGKAADNEIEDTESTPRHAALNVVAHFDDDPDEMWRHLREEHGITQSGDSARRPGTDFMRRVHDTFGNHRHQGQPADVSRMFTPIPAEELEARRRAAEPQPERLDDREYSINDVSRHYDWEGFDPHEIEHLVHHPERATFTREDVPVHSLRLTYEHGIGPAMSYQDIAGQDEDEHERLGELERGYDEGARIPPIVVVRDGEHHIIADGSHRAAIFAQQGRTHIPAFVTERTIYPEQHTAALEATAYSYEDDEGPFTWDEIAQRHPRVYGDDEGHEPGMGEGGGHGIADAAAELYHDRPSHPYSESTGELHPEYSDEIQFHPRTVDVNRIDYMREDRWDPRVTRAREGFKTPQGRQNIPPLILVHRHGVYQVADGHHRANGAAQANWPSVRAYVAYSPHEDEPFAGRYGDPPRRGPFHGAELQDREPFTDQHGVRRRISYPGFPHAADAGIPLREASLVAHFEGDELSSDAATWNAHDSQYEPEPALPRDPRHPQEPSWGPEPLSERRIEQRHNWLSHHLEFEHAFDGYTRTMAQQANGMTGGELHSLHRSVHERALRRDEPSPDEATWHPHEGPIDPVFGALEATAVIPRNHWDMTEDQMRRHLNDEHGIADPGEDPAAAHWGKHSDDDYQPHVHPDLEQEFVRAQNPSIPQGDAFISTPGSGPIDPVFGSLEPAPDPGQERSDRWYEYRGRNSGHLHRGIHVRLPEDLDSYVHDESVPREQRAQALQEHFSGDGLGMHWTPHTQIAQRAIWNAADGDESGYGAWAQEHGLSWDDDDEYGDYDPGDRRDDGGKTDVMFHVVRPGERNRLPQRDQEQYSIGWQHSRDEDEFPVRPGAPLKLAGISWKRHEPQYPNEPFEHHDFGRPIRHVASTAPATAKKAPPATKKAAVAVLDHACPDKVLPAIGAPRTVLSGAMEAARAVSSWSPQDVPEAVQGLGDLPGVFEALGTGLDALAAKLADTPLDEDIIGEIAGMAAVARIARDDSNEVLDRLRRRATEGTWEPPKH